MVLVKNYHEIFCLKKASQITESKSVSFFLHLIIIKTIITIAKYHHKMAFLTPSPRGGGGTPKKAPKFARIVCTSICISRVLVRGPSFWGFVHCWKVLTWLSNLNSYILFISEKISILKENRILFWRIMVFFYCEANMSDCVLRWRFLQWET